MAPTGPHVLGVMSLIAWSLILIVSVKYLFIVLRADNEGEGGVLALTALVIPEDPEPATTRVGRAFRRLILVPVGLFGAALLFGDGILTPSISVLSAVEGLTVLSPGTDSYVLPLAAIVIVALFLFQRRGTAGVGRLFGPISLLWFFTIAALGVRGILVEPSVLAALNPQHAIQFLAAEGGAGLVVLGAVFLVVTGVEALYADLGHFGRGPIRFSWFAVVFPCLMLNYFGQTALVLSDPAAAASPFFLLAPPELGLPLVLLATAAAVIASQAVISGVYSLVNQAVQLGFWPRTTVRHTSETEFGQIYVGRANWALMVGTLAVVFTFRSSAALAAAYGIAIVLTMVATSILLLYVAPSRIRWPRWLTAIVLVGFLVIELAFLSQNFEKVLEGGWLPLTIAVLVFAAALIWHHGRAALNLRLSKGQTRVEDLIDDLPGLGVVRVPGSAVYLTRSLATVPPALAMNVRHHHTLHEKVVLLSVRTENVPHIPMRNRAVVEKMTAGFWRVRLRYGFMDEPDVSAALPLLESHGVGLPLQTTTFFLGREQLVTAGSTLSVRAWVAVFTFMARNSERATQFFNLPPQQVVEVGAQIRV